MSTSTTYHTNKNVVYACFYHVIWCPKYRRDVLRSPVDQRLKEILREVALERNATIQEMEVMPDHVHLLVSVDPQYGIHRLVKQMKGRSSRLLRQEFRETRTRLPSLWTNSYFVCTVGGAPLSAIQKYIERQKDV